VYQAGRRSRFGLRHRKGASFAPPSRFGTTGPSRNIYKAKTGRRWPKRVLIGLGSLIVVIALMLVAGYFYVDSTLGGIKRVAVAGLTPEHGGQPIDILLIGSDSRSFVTSSQLAQHYGSAATNSGQRSDVIVVVRLIPSTGRVVMMSIPRDLWVPIAGTNGYNKINAAFNSGPSQLVKTIQHDLGIPVNHVMMVNFPGFSGMVDSLGGIYLNFPMPVRDRYSGLDITTKGCQLVNGTQALALVRSRHLYYYAHGTWNYDGMSDWSRIRRQQAFFHALLLRLHGVIPDVFRLNSFLGASVSDLAVDSSFSSSEMMSLGMKYHSLSTGGLASDVLPTSPEVVSGQDILVAPQPATQQAVAEFLAAGTTTAALPGSVSTGSSGPLTAVLTASMSPLSGIVYDTPQALPEPWNPTPC
jgi:LCP family protein required for cell wall assembly